MTGDTVIRQGRSICAAMRNRAFFLALLPLLCLSPLLFSTPWVMAATSSTTAKEDKVKPVLKTPPKGTRVNVISDRMTYDSRTKIAVATGRVELTYGPYDLI